MNITAPLVEKSYSYDGSPSHLRVEKKDLNNFFVSSTSLSKLWNRLFYSSQSFKQKPNTNISDILQEEIGISTVSMIKSVLSSTLNLQEDSENLKKAIEVSNKIYHEDYPADFILEYKGERLGMALLDICYDSNNNPKPVYKFNAGLKSFDGLY